MSILTLAPIALQPHSTVLISRRQFSINLLRYQSTFTKKKQVIWQSKRRNIYNGRNEDLHKKNALSTSNLNCLMEQTDAFRQPNLQRHVQHHRHHRHRVHNMPQASSTQHMEPLALTTKALYSGYRPIFLNQDDLESKTVYEFSMNLNNINDTLKDLTKTILKNNLVNSGVENYNFWETDKLKSKHQNDIFAWKNIPLELQEKLLPYRSPNDIIFPNLSKDNNNNHQDNDMGPNDKLINELQKVLKSQNGKKQVISMIPFKKSH